MPGTKRDGAGGVSDLLAPLGTIVALALPYFALSLASAEAAREARLAAQASGAVLVLLGLAFVPPGREEGQAGPPRLAAAARAALLAGLVLFVLSFAAGVARDRDPLDALPLLPPLALLLWGTTQAAGRTAPRALGLLVLAGAATGLLAAAQRFAGVFRLPVDAGSESRFWATGLIGNPGDVGAALVIPFLLSATALARARGGRRLPAALAVASCGVGLAAAGTLAPLAGAAAGAAILVALDPRRRLLPALGIGAATLVLLFPAGVVRRVVEKVSAGSVGELTTQRDIGFLAAMEMVRDRPLLGTGPGGFGSRFVPARVAAEARVHRRLRHASSSSHFDNAHSDPLTIAAEVGIPAAVAFATGLGALLACLAARTRRERDAEGNGIATEALFASLAGVAVLSLANFPLQIAPVSGPFAFVAGLSLSRVGLPGLRASTGRARAALAALALVLAAGAGLRFVSSRAQSRAEAALALARQAGGPGRAFLLDRALAEGRRAVALRRRHPPALLALGSAHAARGERDQAEAVMKRSLALEERAETVLNLGLLALARGDAAGARPLFVRAAWLHPRLADAIPPAGDPAGVEGEVARREAGLAAGEPPPPLRLR